MNTSRTAILTVAGLAHAFAERQVLSHLDLSVGRGETVGLLGPNGSGKSTAFAVLSGLLECQQGELRFDGQPIGDGRDFRRQLGVVFQSPSLDPALSARQNLSLAASLQAIRGADAARRVEERLAWAGLMERADEEVSTFSGGMRRRLDIARALLHEPRMLLMDEPTSGLDEGAFRATWDRLQAAQSERELSILVTTHRPEEAERCDRIAILHGGRVVEEDTPEALRSRVAQDIVVVTGEAPEQLRELISSALQVETTFERHSGEILIEAEQGHTLIPRLVEALPEGRLSSVSLRRPTLADVFLKVTGAALDVEIDA